MLQDVIDEEKLLKCFLATLSILSSRGSRDIIFLFTRRQSNLDLNARLNFSDNS